MKNFVLIISLIFILFSCNKIEPEKIDSNKLVIKEKDTRVFPNSIPEEYQKNP
jgi:hypothetical protein